MSEINSVKGKVALIAGGAKNLGGLISKDFAVHGCEAVAIHYNSQSTKADAENTLAEVEKAGAKGILLQADLTKVSGCVRIFDETIKAFGRFDIAVNTAGLVIKKPIVEITEEDYDSSFCY